MDKLTAHAREIDITSLSLPILFAQIAATLIKLISDYYLAQIICSI